MISRSRSGSTVCVCEPQSVRTDFRYFGLYGLRTSKTFRPSHVDGSAGVVVAVLLHVSFVRRESVDVTRIPSLTVTSFCEPGQWMIAASAGSWPSRTSQICTPS
jgi:hypothetical protein